MSDYESDWAAYHSRIESKVSVIAVDLNLHSKAPIAKYPNTLWFILKFAATAQNGMPTPTERKVIEEIEDSFIPLVENDLNGVYVSRITRDGYRYYYFYASNKEFPSQIAAEFKKKYPKRSIQFGSKSDPDWSRYLRLMYPSPRQLQTILNQRVIENLKKNGDNLKNRRKIDHLAYFQTKADRQNFLTEIEKLGFAEMTTQDSARKGSYPLNFDRSDIATEESLERIFDLLWPLIEKYKADYDGWGCEIAP